MMIDTHCHLSSYDYDSLDEVIKRMGNNIMIVSGADEKSNLEVIKLCDRYSNIYGTVGFHPEVASVIGENELKRLEHWLDNPKIVGIGEIGLDYHYEGYDKDKQIELFKIQLDMASKYHKSVVIHSRDAISDTYEILKKYDLKGVIHAYSSSVEMAKKFIEINYKLGIGGVVTFKNGRKLQEVVSLMPMDCLVLETDSPWLAPEPLRGTKNEPYNILYVALKIAEIKNISLDEVLNITTSNACALFDLML